MVDRHSLNNVDYVRILIGNLDVSLVPPVVTNVNIGDCFYDIEFVRELPKSKQGKEVSNTMVGSSDKNEEFKSGDQRGGSVYAQTIPS